MTSDVVVVGAGPAGCAIGLALARAGVGVTLLDAGRAPSVGEHVDPTALAAFETAGSPDLAAEGHRPLAGRVLCAGAERIEHDFLAHPRGRGFALDRVRFEATLRARASAAGARCVGGRLVRVRVDRGFELETTSSVLRARFVVDASGRVAAFARRVGAERRLLARRVARHVTLAGRLTDPRLVVEAVARGHWYSLGTEASAIVCAQARSVRELDALEVPAVAAQRLAGRSRLHTRLVDASTTRLDAAVGPGWVAIGDAAFAHDPLTGHGIACALASGDAMATAIVRELAGARGAIAEALAIRERAFARAVHALAELGR